MAEASLAQLKALHAAQENYIRHVEARLRQLEADVTGTGFGFTALWVNDQGELILTYSGVFPNMSIDANGELILTHSGPTPPVSIDNGGHLVVEF